MWAWRSSSNRNGNLFALTVSGSPNKTKEEREKENITYKKLKVGSMADRLKDHDDKFLNVCITSSQMFNP